MLASLRFACRSLARTPGFTLVAIGIVGLGIAAATTMFSTVNALVLRPLPVSEPERLVSIYENNLSRNVTTFSVSYPNYLDWRDRTQSFASLAAIGSRAMNLTGEGEPEFLYVQTVTANFLPTLGQSPALGRNFTADEDRPGHNQVALISHAFWQRRFAGRPDILEQKLILNGAPHAIVGVMAADAYARDDFQIVVPMGADLAEEDRSNHELSVLGRLRPGVTPATAEADLKAIAAAIAMENPQLEQGWSVYVQPLMEDIFEPQVRTALFVLLGAVALLLLIACANLSNLLLVRTAARSHELAVRTALGAGRRRLVLQVATESFLVTSIGGLVGFVGSLWATDLMRLLPLPRAPEISMDLRVLGVSIGATLFAGLFAGLLPALRATQTRPHEALKTRSSVAVRRSRLRDATVIAQLGLSLTLLVGATLLGRSFVRLLQVDPGFVTDHAVTLSLRPADSDRAAAFYDRVTERLRTLPSVRDVGAISALPLTEGNTSLNVFAPGESLLAPGESVQASWRLIDGGYFSAMGIPLVRGRTFAGLTPDEARRSLIVSEELARRLWGDADPIGRQLDPGGNQRLLTVIGVVGDVRSSRLGVPAGPMFYWSMHRFIYGPMHLVVRHQGEAAPLVSAIRAAVKEIDPTVPIFRVRTLEQLRRTSLDQERLILGLLTAFTAAALVLAALGTYGVIAFSVQQRTTEFGIRIAVGAQARDILRLVLGQGLRLVLLGSLAGLLGAYFATRVIGVLLFNTPATDPLSYLGATALLAVVAFAAAFIPARRATKVDPMIALRND